MFRNPYAQVALTYARHLFRPNTFLFLLMACFLVQPAGTSPDARSVTVLFAFAMFACLRLTLHISEQFANWPAHLVPKFRRVHAIVAAAAALIVTIALSAVLAPLAGCSAVATAAMLAVIFGVSLRSLAHPQGDPLSRIVHIGFLLLLAAWVLVPPLREEVVRFMRGQLELQAIILSCAGLVMIVGGAVQLSRRHGDVREVQFLSSIWDHRRDNPWAALPRLDERSVGNWLVFRRFDGQIGRLVEHARHASRSRWSAACRWRVGMPNGWTSWLLGIGVVLAMQLAMQFAAWLAAGEKSGHPTFFWSTFVLWLIACPSFVSWSQLAPRNKLLGYEIMLPVERRNYLKQVGIAVAISCLRTWGGMYAAFMLWWITAAPEPLRFGLVLNVLACSALAQVGFFGMGLCLAWLAKRESPQLLPILLPLVVGASWGVLGFPILVVCVGLNQSPLPGVGNSVVALVGAALFAAFGLLLTWFLYRRWLVADLD